MSALSRKQTRLTRIEAQITVFETALETQDLGRVKSYSRGFGIQSTTYQDLDAVRKHLDWLYEQQDQLNAEIEAIQGTVSNDGIMVAAFREA